MENNNLEELKKYKLYTAKEIESVLGVSAQSIKRYIKAGKLHAIKVGGKWRVSEEDLKEFLNK